jgi:WD40 repeat protein
MAVNKIVKAIKSYIPLRIPTTLKCTCLQSTKDESRVFFGTKEGRIGIVERESEEVIKVEDASRHPFTCLILDNNDEFLFVSGPEGLIQKFNRELSHVLDLPGHTGCVNDFSMSKDNNFLFSASSDGTIRLWPSAGGESRVLFTHQSEFYAIDLSGNQKILSFAGEAGLIFVGEIHFEALQGSEASEDFFKVVKTVECPEPIYSLQFSITHFYLVTGDKKGAIHVYDSEYWNVIRKFNHGDTVNQLSISAEENLIVSCGKDCTLKVWDMKGKHEEVVLRLHTAPVKGCVITKDQKSIISGGNDGFVIVWRMPVFESETRWKTRNFDPVDLWFSTVDSRLEGFGLSEVGTSVVWWDLNGNMNKIFDIGKTRREKTHCLANDELAFFYKFDDEEDRQLVNEGLDELEEYVVVDVYNLREEGKKRTHLIQSSCLMAQVSKDKQFCFTGEYFRVKIWNYSNFQHVLTVPSIIGIVRSVLYEPSLSIFVIYDDSRNLNKVTLSNLSSSNAEYSFTGNMQVTSSKQSECKMEISTNKLFLMVALTDQFFIVILETFQIIKTYNTGYLGLHLTSKNTILLYMSTGIDYYSEEDFSLLACYRKKFLIDKLVLTPDQSEFTILHKNTFSRQSNPVGSKTVKLISPKSEELEIVNHVYSVIKKKCTVPYSGLPFLIEPLHINVLHIYAQRNNGDLLRQGIESGIPYISSYDGWTPLSVSIRANFNDCIKSVFKGLATALNPSTIPTDALTYQKLEHDLIKLNESGHESLHRLYDRLYIEEISNNNPNLCDIGLSLPVITYSDSPFINCESMGISKEPPERTNAVCYKKSLVRFSLEMGSNESLAFLKSIKSCSNKEIFRTELIQTILDEKWTKARRLMIYQAVVYVLYLASLVAYLSGPDELIWLAFILNCLLYAYELIFIVIDPRNYFRSFWNLVDTTRAGLLVYYFFAHNRGTDLTGLLSVILMISWIRGITYFRINFKSRYLIGLLFQVIIDIVPFLIIFLYTTLGYAIIQGLLMNRIDEPFKNFMNSYLISSGSWENFRNLTVTQDTQGNIEIDEALREATDYIYPISIIVITIINPVIVVNLLVSILSETYEKVQEMSQIADGLELVDMIIEIETLFYWNRQVKDKQFIHTAVLNVIQEDADDLEVQDLIRKVKDKLEAVKIEIIEKSQSFHSLMTRNENFKGEVSSKLAQYLEKLA